MTFPQRNVCMCVCVCVKGFSVLRGLRAAETPELPVRSKAKQAKEGGMVSLIDSTIYFAGYGGAYCVCYRLV